jgi:hypothetical protein
MRNCRRRRLTVLWRSGAVLPLLGAIAAFACSSDGEGGVGSGVVSPGPNGDGTGTRPLAEPRSSFRRARPGVPSESGQSLRSMGRS